MHNQMELHRSHSLTKHVGLDKKKKRKIDKIKKKNGKRTKEYKIKRMSVNAKFKILGRKVDMYFDIGEYFADILFEVIFQKKKG